ncbi:hypothetical protein IT401_02785 [Candidatus Nomurabacteria bacterium]|nr:hypothetical protein [Candidatus Nomurabacteria bacterium]
MKFGYFFEIKEAFTLQAYADAKTHRWESGGAFGSDWSENRWYEGIMVISRRDSRWYFFFKTFTVRDEALPEFSYQALFGDMTIREVMDKCEQLGKKSDNSPFPFVEIGRDFISISAKRKEAENVLLRIKTKEIDDKIIEKEFNDLDSEYLTKETTQLLLKILKEYRPRLHSGMLAKAASNYM